MKERRFIPVNAPEISEKSKDNIKEALDTGWISSAGKFVSEFEEKFSGYLGKEYGVAVSSGTAAIHVALMAAEIGPEDEVIVPAFTMAGSWLPILYVGAKPVFVDCELETFNIDTDKIQEKITPQTKAIIPVHIYGHPVDMDPVAQIADENDLLVIEDAAEAHGAEYKGKRCGSMGDISCFSFYANKIISTGEGGMVITDDEEVAARARKFRDLHHSETRFIHDGVGFNYRMTNLQGALGCGELGSLDEYVAKKQKMAEMYIGLLENVPGLRLPITKPYAFHVYWMFPIMIEPEEFGMNKNSLRDRLKERKIDTRDFFYSPKGQPVLSKYLTDNDTFPNTEYIQERGLYLPSGLALTEAQIELVAQEIIDVHTQIKTQSSRFFNPPSTKEDSAV